MYLYLLISILIIFNNNLYIFLPEECPPESTNHVEGNFEWKGISHGKYAYIECPYGLNDAALSEEDLNTKAPEIDKTFNPHLRRHPLRKEGRKTNLDALYLVTSSDDDAELSRQKRRSQDASPSTPTKRKVYFM